jgi:hypothetical protein
VQSYRPDHARGLANVGNLTAKLTGNYEWGTVNWHVNVNPSRAGADVDAEGERGAARLRQLSPRRHRIRTLVGEDVTAFRQAAGRVGDWVRFELGRL